MVKFSELQLYSFTIIFTAYSQILRADRSFVINYENNSFYMDGKPFRYISGSAHYFRVPNQYWRDRLRKLRAAGLNAVSTYVEWSQHEAIPGEFNFSGDLNVKKFIQIAQEEGLYVILRAGPYICAERDMGGLPYWLMRKNSVSLNDVQLRTIDIKYTEFVEKWIDVLMQELAPLLYGRGGPIILVQVENEFGSYFSCDYNYTSWLRDLFKKHVKDDAVLFTTDGPDKKMLQCGKIPGVYATIDFGTGSNVTKAFEMQRRIEPQGPLVNSEFYSGWLTHWGEKMARVKTSDIIRSLKTMLDKGANVNFYMFFGGTNFGFTAGANFVGKYQSDITSYDYDAPITEAGDLTDKYYKIKEVVLQYLPSDINISVNSSEKGDYGEITLRRTASLFSSRIREAMGKLRYYTKPLPFEALNQNFGFVLYETDIPQGLSRSSKSVLYIKLLKDLGHVYVNGNLIGNMSREFYTQRLEIKNMNEKRRLSILVENLGRINFGNHINDAKGILSNVTLDETNLSSWNMTGFELKNLNAVEDCYEENIRSTECDNDQGFLFYMGKFRLPQKRHDSLYELDSFLDVSHLTKGLIFINGYNLGRYWSSRGPQYTLYVPGVYLKSYPQENTIIILEENITTTYIKIKFVKTPIFT